VSDSFSLEEALQTFPTEPGNKKSCTLWRHN